MAITSKEEKIKEIKIEQNKYKPVLTVNEIQNLVDEKDKKCNRGPLSLEEINQYISEVRKNVN